MKTNNPIITTCIICYFLSTLAQAQTEKLDNVAACTGVVIGNGAVDFYMDNEQSFDDAANIAYSAYLSEVYSGQYGQDDLKVADQILGGNVDKIINAHNSETFTAEVYEEVVDCYRALARKIIEDADRIIKTKTKWLNIKNSSIKTLKRMLRAG